MRKYVIFKFVLLLGAICLYQKTAFALPGTENEFTEQADIQTEQHYMQNPAGQNPGNKMERSSTEKIRLESERVGVAALAPDQLTHRANVHAPMAGVSDFMYSKEHANQIGKSLGSPMVLYHATMLLTEPAVAGAVHNSFMEGYGSLGNRYLAEENFVHELESDPQSRQILLPAYRECVANQLRDHAGSVSGTTSADRKSWIEAQSVCMGDRSDSIGKVNNKPNNEFNNLNGSGFDFYMDPNHPHWQNKPGAGNEIRLTDYLFNRSNWQIVAVDLDALKKSFQEMLGDYEFKVEDAPTASGGSGAPVGRSASRELSFTRVEATKPRKEIYKDAENANYETIMDLVYQRCDYNRAAAPSPGGGGGNNTVKLPFCDAKKATLKPEFLKVSFVGYEFDCNMVEDLFKIFTFENPNMETLSGKGGAKIDCSVVSGGDYENLHQNPDTIKSGHARVLFLAEQVTLGQVYNTIYNIQQVVENVSITQPEFVRNFSYQLLNEFMGTGDLSGKYQKVLAKIELFREKISEEIERRRPK
jgi:hypothetical protein